VVCPNQVFVKEIGVELREPIGMGYSCLRALLKPKARRVPKHRVGIVGGSDPCVAHARRTAVRLNAEKEGRGLGDLSVGSRCKHAAGQEYP
jgi:hypothetical protein